MVATYSLPSGWRAASWQKALQHDHGNSSYQTLLESGKSGRYTYFSRSATQSLQYGNGQLTEMDASGEQGKREWETTDPISALRLWLHSGKLAPAEQVCSSLPPFIGGITGYFSYDMAREIERLPVRAVDDLHCPAYYFTRVHELYVMDHADDQLYCIYIENMNRQEENDRSDPTLDNATDEEVRAVCRSAQSVVSGMFEWFRQHVLEQEDADDVQRRRACYERYATEDSDHRFLYEDPRWHSPFSKAQYMEAVRRIQAYILDGDVFQANLSLRRSRPLVGSAVELYEWLRLINPSPYMGYLRFPEFEVASASPELLVRLHEGKVSARPIAGTRRRGKNEEEDVFLEQELLESEKERAEHVMLVDLDRNDLGRVSRYGSVQVEELMVIERYSHVMHLVSEVTGQLRDGADALDVIRAKFPGGTITGAPKVRTMEIIEELEPVRRGLYTGSMGWIDYRGNMEFNIVIRTMLVKDGLVHVQAGAGIVIDSDPEREFKESLNKARALSKALEYQERYYGDPSRHGSDYVK
ncbi:anthranilate synthase component I family protein [Marinicrinis sediminis]